MKTQTLSVETKRKISESRKGQRHSIEARKNMSEAKKGILHEGGFKKGLVPWNKQGKERPKRKQIRIDGKKMENSHYVYMTYHNLKEIPKGFIIHHIDENPLNDDITNLRMMRAEDHNFLHQVLDKERLRFKIAIKKLKDDFHKFYSHNRPFIKLFDEKIDEIFGSELSK